MIFSSCYRIIFLLVRGFSLTIFNEFIRTVKLLEPTFGGINLEDIKAPDCFYIEEKLKAALSIPVFHDDQHGTAIISGAAMLNVVKLTGRRLKELRVVINGAGAEGIACARFYVQLGGKEREPDVGGRQGNHLPRTY